MLLTLAAIAALVVAYFMLAQGPFCWSSSGKIPGSGDPGHVRPAATDFEPMTAEDTAAQPAAVDPVAMATSVQPPAAHPAGRSQQVVPADLLPQNIERQWLKDSKVQSLTMPSVVAPDFRAGRDPIGQSLKNPNLQIRPDPPITRNVDLGPWSIDDGRSIDLFTKLPSYTYNDNACRPRAATSDVSTTAPRTITSGGTTRNEDSTSISRPRPATTASTCTCRTVRRTAAATAASPS